MAEEEPPVHKFSIVHIVENVSKLKNRVHNYSPLLEQCNEPWKIWYERSGDHLGVCLYCMKPKNEAVWSIPVKCRFKVMSSDGKYYSRIFNMTYSNSDPNNGYGSLQFLSWNDLLENYLINDKMIISADVEVGKMIGVDGKSKLKKFDENQTKGLVDVVLVLKEEKFHVSKAILNQQSAFFKIYESQVSEITINDDIDPEFFQCFLETIHLEPTLTDSCIEGVLHISNLYDAKNVKRVCEEFLIENSKHSLKKKIQLSISYDLEVLKKFCIDGMKTAIDIRSAMDENLTDADVLKTLLEKSSALK